MSHRLRTVLLLLALLAGLPGTLFAGCGTGCPPAAQRVAMPCCHPVTGTAPAVRAASCCPTVQAAAPAETAPAVSPTSPTVLALTSPLALPAEPLIERPMPAEPPVGPPPLHEGIDLYTLHSVFLI